MTKPHKNARPHKAYKARQRGPLIICCGVKTYDDQMGRTFHDNSILHRNHKRIVRYLEKNCMTFTEIGLRLGITREAVRQIAERMGAAKGHNRRKVCSLTRGEQEWQKALRTNILGRFTKECEAQGLEWTRVPQGRHDWSQTTLVVEGQLVKVRTASYNTRGYIQMHGVSDLPSVSAFELPQNRGWLLMPRERRLTAGTCFSLDADEPGGKGWTYNRRHDFASMVNEWTVFRKRAVSQAA